MSAPVQISLHPRDLLIIQQSLEKSNKEFKKLSNKGVMGMVNPFVELHSYVTGLEEKFKEESAKHPYKPKEFKEE